MSGSYPADFRVGVWILFAELETHCRGLSSLAKLKLVKSRTFNTFRTFLVVYHNLDPDCHSLVSFLTLMHLFQLSSHNVNVG